MKTTTGRRQDDDRQGRRPDQRKDRSQRTANNDSQSSHRRGTNSKSNSQGHQNNQSPRGSSASSSGNSSSGNNSSRTFICYNCDQEGHRAFECTKPKRNRSAIRKIQVFDRNEEELPNICSVISKKIDGRRHSLAIHGATQSGNVVALLDSGADFNVIHPDVVEQFQSTGLMTISTPVKFATAKGNGVAKYQVLLDVEISSGMLAPVRIRTKFAVSDCGENMILGWHWLAEHDLHHLLTPTAEEPVTAAIEEFDCDDVKTDEEALWDDPVLQEKTDRLLEEHSRAFDRLGNPAKVPPFTIELEDTVNLPRAKPRPYPAEMRKMIKKQVDEMLELGIIQESFSPYASPVVMQAKKVGDPRLCVDYRTLNAATKSMRLPMPNGHEVIQRMKGSKYFARIDLKKGFHQIPITEESIPYTAFVTQDGLYEYKTMPFGLKNPSGFFQWTMEQVLAGLPHCEIFVDDIIIHADTQSAYLDALDRVLDTLIIRGFKLNKEKCLFGLRTVEYIGHIVSEQGVSMSKARKEAVRQIPVPRTHKQLRSFLGFVNYFRKFVPDMARLSAPLHELTKKAVKFVWTDRQQEAFERIKEATANCSRLSFPSEDGKLILRTDASEEGIGAHLAQVLDNGEEQTIGFFSQSFNPTQKRWSTIEQEAYGIYAAIKHWDHFVWGRQFTVDTDHRNLVYIHRCAAAKIVRWRLQLAEYDFVIQHIAGKDNLVADFLSRFPRPSDDPEIKMISSDDAQMLDGASMESTGRQQPGRASSPEPAATARTQNVRKPLRERGISRDLSLQPYRATDKADREHRIDLLQLCGDMEVDLQEIQHPGLKEARHERYSEMQLELTPSNDKSMVQNDKQHGLKHTMRQQQQRRQNNAAAIQRLEEDLPRIAPITYRREQTQFDRDFDAAHSGIRGHQGVEVTMARLRKNGVDYNHMRDQVKDRIASCAICQKVRLGQGNIVAAVKTTAVDEPFAHLMWDTIGPLEPDAVGYEYIIVAIDRFTRFIELIPTRTVGAHDAAVALVQIAGRYGGFKTLHSDRGKQFDSAVIKQICALMDITTTYGAPYRPESQGLVERSNRETMTHLRAMIPEAPGETAWSDLLPLVQRLYNTTVNRNTGAAPAKLMFGDAVDLDRQLLFPTTTGDERTYSQYVQDLLEAQRKIVAASAKHQEQAVKDALKRAPPTPTVIEPGTPVLVLPAARGKRSKLQPRWLGPMNVIHHVGDTYHCQDLNSGRVKHVHIGRLKIYKEDPRYENADVALWDSETALVDEVVQHRAGRTRAAYQFKVSWKDYGPESNQWLPYREVKHTTAFAEYIRRVPLPLFPPHNYPLEDDAAEGN